MSVSSEQMESNRPMRAPLVVIERSRGVAGLDLHDVWAYRELLLFLAWRDVKVRYKQTLLGVLWVLLQPVLTMIVFSVLFGRLAGVPSDGIPYPLFAFAGLLPWLFFSNALAASGNSLVGSASLVSKVYFPRVLIPAAAVLAGLVDFAIAFGLLFILLPYYGVAPGPTAVVLPFLVLLLAVLALAVGMLFSALNVKYRDVRHALPFLVQIWMFLSPILYPASIVPAEWRLLYALNPLAGIVEAFRAALTGRELDGTLLLVSTAVTAALLCSAGYLFRRMERSFADVV